MHDIDYTQLELGEAEVQEEILKKAFARVAQWLRRQPSAPPQLPPPQSPFRTSGRVHEARERLASAKKMLEKLIGDKAGAGPSLSKIYDKAIRDQEQVIRALEAELRNLGG